MKHAQSYCAFPGCGATVNRHHLMCRNHDALIPESARAQLAAALAALQVNRPRNKIEAASPDWVKRTNHYMNVRAACIVMAQTVAQRQAAAAAAGTA